MVIANSLFYVTSLGFSFLVIRYFGFIEDILYAILVFVLFKLVYDTLVTAIKRLFLEKRMILVFNYERLGILTCNIIRSLKICHESYVAIGDLFYKTIYGLLWNTVQTIKFNSLYGYYFLINVSIGSRLKDLLPEIQATLARSIVVNAFDYSESLTAIVGAGSVGEERTGVSFASIIILRDLLNN